MKSIVLYDGEEIPTKKQMGSNEAQRMRWKSLDRMDSHSTMYFTPHCSRTSSLCATPTFRSVPTTNTMQSLLDRSSSAPPRRQKSAKKKTLRRLASCFRSQHLTPAAAEEEIVENVAAAKERTPRRLRSGGVDGIDLLRFEQSEAQLHEYYSPLVGTKYKLAKATSLPIPYTTQQKPVVAPEHNDTSSQAFTFAQNLQRLKRMSGVYHMDRSRSDSLKPMSDLLELSWALRTAFENSNQMQILVEDPIIKQTGRVFRLVDIAEELHLSGEEVTFKRRDLRKGPVYAKTFLTPLGYINKLRWNDPCAGGLIERFEFSEDGSELQIHCHVYRADGRKCNFKMARFMITSIINCKNLKIGHLT